MVTTLADLDITKPDGATEPVAVLDDYQREAKEATINSFIVEHSLAGPHAFLSGDTAARPVPGYAGRFYINTETKTIQMDNGAGWTDLIHYYTRVKVGTFAGDGASAKGITGIGFSPTYLQVIPLTGTNPAFAKGFNFASGDSHKFSDNTTDVAGIKTLDSDGFTVDANANVNGVTYQYVAFRDRP